MRRTHTLLLAGLLSGLVLLCGCATMTPSSPGTTPVPVTGENLTALLPAMALTTSDLTAGYQILAEGPTISPEEASPGEDPGYRGGYSVTAVSLAANNKTTDMIDQTILVYETGGRLIDLETLFLRGYPDFINQSRSALPDPDIGDASIGYRFTVPADISPSNTTINGNVIVFRKGKVYEMVMLYTTAPEANETFALEIAKKAAARI